MENGIVKPMLRSLLISYVLSGILLAALAFALYKLRLKEGQVNLMVYAVYLLTCLCGGFLAGKRIRQRRFFWGLLSGLLYFLVLFAVSWAMNMGSAIDMERSVTVMGNVQAQRLHNRLPLFKVYHKIPVNILGKKLLRINQLSDFLQSLLYIFLAVSVLQTDPYLLLHF